MKRDAVLNSGDTLMWQERPDIGLSIAYGDFTLRGGYIRNKMGPYIGATNALNDETVQDWGPRDGNTDKRLHDVPSHKANAGLNLAYLNANVNVSWIGERPWR